MSCLLRAAALNYISEIYDQLYILLLYLCCCETDRNLVKTNQAEAILDKWHLQQRPFSYLKERSKDGEPNEKIKKVFTFISALIDKSWGVLLVDSQLSLSAGPEKERGKKKKAWVQKWDNASSVDSDLACGD